MIVETMTKDEILREINSDDEWCAERCIGLAQKYRKALKNKRIANFAVLGRVQYTTPNHNKVYGIVQKLFVGEGEKYAVPSIVTIYEYVSADGKRRYIYPLLGIGSRRHIGLIVFTDHAITRLRERCGKSMMDLFNDIAVLNDTCMSFCNYDYNGKDDEHFSVVGDTILLARDSEWGVTITTVLNKTQLYENQEDMKDFLDDHINGIREENISHYRYDYDKSILKETAIRQVA